ncbi:CoA ester lyase [Sphingobium sp. BS19]|uniref:HpcH/HpaI aldolase/citrate lyase family protein n=1 Tax=Sphingobium sp. BS19 TaxID=3018973 RepID=UPI0022EEA3D0|nr:CoA ester lyase [Sphingobium sp. BS19]GLI97460.1 citryl-CoA lyase [Sphingobium sp. BS19]
MRLRALLFVPGDRPERFAKAAASGADALILDLEDSVSAANKIAARDAIASWLSAPRTITTFVRIDPLDSGMAQADLDAILSARPDGIMLPKAEGADSVRHLLTLMGDKAVPILPIATETAAAVFTLGTYRDVSAHLAGLTWGAEDLPAAIGAATSREADGSYTDPYRMVRSLTLFGAHAAGVAAIETVFPNIKDLDALAAYAARGRRDGFTGMMAIHPAQVPIINTAFTPSEADLAHARAIVAAFEANPGAGALQLDGKMIDAPHLKQAMAVLAGV